jgi:Tfp pilus assembly protein PilN
MRQINLLPPELAARRQLQRVRAGLVVGLVAMVAVLVLTYVVQAARLTGERRTLARQDATNRALQRKVTALEQFAQLQTELRNKRELLVSLTAFEVRWSVLFADISLVIPADVWLTNLTGTVQAPAPGAQRRPGEAAAPVGQIQFSGCTLQPLEGTHLESAQFLIRIGVPREFVAPYLTLSAKGGPECPVQFNASVNLGELALRSSQRGAERVP